MLLSHPVGWKVTGEDLLSGRGGPGTSGQGPAGPQGLSKLRSPKRKEGEGLPSVLQAGLAPGTGGGPAGTQPVPGRAGLLGAPPHVAHASPGHARRHGDDLLAAGYFKVYQEIITSASWL